MVLSTFETSDGIAYTEFRNACLSRFIGITFYKLMHMRQKTLFMLCLYEGAHTV